MTLNPRWQANRFSQICRLAHAHTQAFADALHARLCKGGFPGIPYPLIEGDSTFYEEYVRKVSDAEFVKQAREIGELFGFDVDDFLFNNEAKYGIKEGMPYNAAVFSSVYQKINPDEAVDDSDGDGDNDPPVNVA